jgi:ribonuclease R
MYNKSQLSQMCEHLSEQEQKAAKAQRESIKYKQCEFLKSKIGEKFKGIISSVNSFGVFIEIIENGCDGLISKDSLESNNLYIDQENFCVNDFNDGGTYRLGDECMIQVERVNMTKKQIDFKILLT